MTDKEKLIVLFREFGIEFKESTHHRNGELDVIELEVGNKKVEGYFGFGSSYSFDKKTGKFIEVEIYE